MIGVFQSMEFIPFAKVNKPFHIVIKKEKKLRFSRRLVLNVCLSQPSDNYKPPTSILQEK